LLGYRPQLFQCVACRRQIEPATNFFSPADGGILCANCGENHRGAKEITLTALKVLRFLQTRDYDTCCRLHLSPPLHRELEKVMYDYITYILERSLKSVKFLNTLRRQRIGSG
jgi:DNA repair protein RecO (recombination protein O)